MEAFSRAMLNRFERELLADLKIHYAADYERVGEAGVLQLIRQANHRGMTYGIVAERDIATIAELDLSLGAPFERQKGCEWAGAVLRDSNITPAGRLALILARLPAA